MSLKTRPKCNLGIVISYHSSVNLNFSGRLPDSYFCAVLIYFYHFLGFIYGQCFLNCQSLEYTYCHAMQFTTFLHIVVSVCSVGLPLSLSLLYSSCRGSFTFFLLFTASILLFYCFANAWEFSALLMIEVLFKPLLIPKKRGSFVQARVLLILRKCQQCGSGDLQG